MSYSLSIHLSFGGIVPAIACLLISNGVVCAEEETPTVKVDEKLKRGEELYLKTCAVCHGEKGEGVEKFYPDPLVGNLTVGDLTEVIAETMPEDDPESFVGAEAAAVAAYIHKAFYSVAAQIRIKPPRVGLARLTGNQLRHSLADLYSTGANAVWMSADHGLRGSYYIGSRHNDDQKRLERTDRCLHFDFGHQGPGEGITPEDFCIRWNGAIKPDATGELPQTAARVRPRAPAARRRQRAVRDQDARQGRRASRGGS